MGLRSKPSTSSFTRPLTTPPLPLNPDPSKYIIQYHERHGDFLLLHIYYEGCTNFEGNKVLLFKDVSLPDILRQELIDPHFCDNKNFISPIARFEPTPQGIKLAKKCMGLLND